VPDGCFIVAFEGSSVDEYITLWTHAPTPTERSPTCVAATIRPSTWSSDGCLMMAVRVAPAFAENDALERGVRQLFSASTLRPTSGSCAIRPTTPLARVVR